MSDRLRDRRAIAELAAGPQPIEISDKIQSFERLVAALEDDLAVLGEDGQPRDWRALPVSGEIRFAAGTARDGVVRLTGHAEATVTSVCQRCLQAFRWPLAATLDVVLVPPSQTVARGSDADVWELDDETVRPIDIVDEALVMAMPLSARHEDSDACAAAPAADDGQKTTPFATLRAQMDEQRRN